MARPLLVIALTTLLVVTASPGVAGDAGQADARAEILVGDLVIGENEQRLGPMRAYGYGDVDELVIEIDLTALESRGVETSDVTIDLPGDNVRGASLVSATIEDGIVTLVLEPDESLPPEDSLLVIDAFRLTGLDTTSAEAASAVRLNASFSEGEAVARAFDIIDPDELTPTVTPNPLFTDAEQHVVPVTDIQPADGPVTIEVNTTVLESHGVGLDHLEVDVETEDTTVRETTVEDGVVTVVIGPANDTVLFDVKLELRGLNTTGVDADDRVGASNVTYDVRIDGDADDHVDVHGFDIDPEPPQPETRHQDERTTTPAATSSPGAGTPTVRADPSPGDESTPVSEEAHGFGILIALLALIGSGLAVARHR